jgi:glyoxylase-like metal-dependent hydrolase (beta-lactamase superfamily II)
MTSTLNSFVIGPLENNTYLLSDDKTRQAAVIDPAFGSRTVFDYALDHNLKITDIFCTHAHFDHIAGLNELDPDFRKDLNIWLHPDDLPLWQAQGGARNFGLPFEICCQPTKWFSHQQIIPFGESNLEVRLTPGHTRGHIVLYLKDESLVFCGDLIFRTGVGRTDLEGGSHIQLLKSIDTQILPLADQTRLLSGHGPETTVGYEKKHNPFL